MAGRARHVLRGRRGNLDRLARGLPGVHELLGLPGRGAGQIHRQIPRIPRPFRAGAQIRIFFPPFAVDEMVEKGEADVQVLHSTDKWYGMTYAADRQMVIDAIARMIGEGVYPERL